MTKSKLAYLLPGLALLASCSKDSPEELEELKGTESITEVSSTEVEVASAVPGSVSNIYYAGQEMPVETFQGDYVYQ